MKISRSIALTLTCALAAAPLWAHFGKTTTKFPIQHAAAAKLGDEVKLTVQVAIPNASDEAAFLTGKMTSALKAAGVSVSPSASMEVIVTLDKLEASVNEKRVSQLMATHTGDKELPFGVKVPICRPGQVEVGQKEWLGTASLLLQVRDTKTNVNLASRTLTPVFSAKAITPPAEALKCDVKKQYAKPAGLPTNQADLRHRVLDTAATDAAHLLTGWREEREAMLAICDELQPGNAKAAAGDLNAAIELWSNARMVKTKHLAPYKDYNLAVGYALLALAEEDTDQMQKYLGNAQQHYDAALAGNSAEQGFSAFAGMLTELKTSVDARVAAVEQRQRETQQLVADAEQSKRWLRQPLDPAWFPDGENEDQHAFRSAIRLRFEHVAEGGERAQPLMDEFGRYAIRYNLSPGERNRIVNDEIARLQAVRQAKADYASALKDILRDRRDKVLTAQDRARLNEQIKVLNLTPDMVTELEAKEGVVQKSAPAPKPKAK